METTVMEPPISTASITPGWNEIEANYVPIADCAMPETVPETSEPIPSTPTEHNVEQSLMEKAVLVTLDLRRIGNSRKVDKDKLKVDSDKEMVAISKRLFKCEQLDRIRAHDFMIRSYLKNVTVPSIVKLNFYLLPVESIARVDEQLRRFRYDRQQLVKQFEEAYDNILLGSEFQLGELFRRDDYPSRSEVRGLFKMVWNYTSFNVPDALQEISPQLFESEKEKAAAQWHEASEEIKQIQRATYLQLCMKLEERLKPGADGKRKVFRNTVVTNLTNFMNEFEALNITNDAELADLVTQGRELLAGLDPDELRKSEELSDNIAASFGKITSNIDNLLQEAPKRALSFDEE